MPIDEKKIKKLIEDASINDIEAIKELIEVKESELLGLIAEYHSMIGKSIPKRITAPSIIMEV